jgi:amidase
MPSVLPFVGFAAKGPMARSVADAGFLLSIMAGPDTRDPACYPSNPAAFAQPLDRSFRGAQVAWSLDLGELPLDRRVRGVLERQRRTFEDLGCHVEEAGPDLAGADDVFLTIRRWRSWASHGALLPRFRDQLKPEAVEEIEAGSRVSGADLAGAMSRHVALLDAMRQFQAEYEFLVCAVNQLPPFDAAIDWPREVDGVAMDHYIAWMKSAYWISATFRPAISVPAGFTEDGLPVGIQIVGRYRDDRGVLQLAHAFEQATGFGQKRPELGT